MLMKSSIIGYYYAVNDDGEIMCLDPDNEQKRVHMVFSSVEKLRAQMEKYREVDYEVEQIRDQQLFVEIARRQGRRIIIDPEDIDGGGTKYRFIDYDSIARA